MLLGSVNEIVLVTAVSFIEFCGDREPVTSTSLTNICTKYWRPVKQHDTTPGTQGVGEEVGLRVAGATDGEVVGADLVGEEVGALRLGERVGNDTVGEMVGNMEGDLVGAWEVGNLVGVTDGVPVVGSEVGKSVRVPVGLLVPHCTVWLTNNFNVQYLRAGTP